jgi:O-succinylbenzoate synthase
MINARTVWYLIAWDADRPQIRGIGEAALFPGHSKEFPADVRTKLVELCADTSDWEQRLNNGLVDVPSVRFAVEQCLRDLNVSGQQNFISFGFHPWSKRHPDKWLGVDGR